MFPEIDDAMFHRIENKGNVNLMEKKQMSLTVLLTLIDQQINYNLNYQSKFILKAVVVTFKMKYWQLVL